jgi:hypothetical protein
VGIVAAGIGAITFFPWIYFRPGMAILSIALCVMVIYALAVYGGGRLTSGGRPRA